MKWFVRLFLSEHEKKLMEKANKAIHINVYGKKYVFLDKHGNGFQIVTNSQSPSLLCWMVDGSVVEDSVPHEIPFILTQYLTSLGDKVEAERTARRRAEEHALFIEEVDKFVTKD